MSWYSPEVGVAWWLLVAAQIQQWILELPFFIFEELVNLEDMAWPGLRSGQEGGGWVSIPVLQPRVVTQVADSNAPPAALRVLFLVSLICNHTSLFPLPATYVSETLSLCQKTPILMTAPAVMKGGPNHGV